MSPSTPQDLNRLIRTLNGLKYSSPASKRYPSVVLDSVFEDAREYIKEEHDRALESVIALLCGVYAMTFDDLDEGGGIGRGCSMGHGLSLWDSWSLTSWVVLDDFIS